MSVPKSVIKFKKGEVIYKSSVDYAAYTIKELSRAALRDVGKMLARYANDAANKHMKERHHHALLKYKSPFQYWVRKRETDLQVGVEKTGHKDEWYGASQELGTSGMPKLGILTETTRANIALIREIESKYLTGINADEPDLSGCSEDDYQGGGE